MSPTSATIRAAVLLVATAACTPGATEPGTFDLPHRFRVMGQAAGTNAGIEVGCTMDLVFERRGPGPDASGIYVASGVGEVERTIEHPDGSGLVFTPFLGSDDHRVRLVAPDSVILETPVNLGTGIPFYDGIGRLAGRITGRDTAAGVWTCGDLALDEDGGGSVDGTWRLAPL